MVRVKGYCCCFVCFIWFSLFVLFSFFLQLMVDIIEILLLSHPSTFSDFSRFSLLHAEKCRRRRCRSGKYDFFFHTYHHHQPETNTTKKKRKYQNTKEYKVVEPKTDCKWNEKSLLGWLIMVSRAWNILQAKSSSSSLCCSVQCKTRIGTW